MTKVHPNAPSVETSLSLPDVKDGKEEVMTVWRKSLLFNGEGFTVFDRNGNLRYRVDNYSCGRKGEIVLMDASGMSLLTVRRKRLSLGENWLIYNGDGLINPLFIVKKHLTFLDQSKKLAHVTSCGMPKAHPYTYMIEGSYTQRKCTIYDSNTRVVGEIRRKESTAGVTLGGDVFRLVVQPCFETSLAMAMVIILEQMYK